ncbi:MAG: hypothetical protein MR430_00910 [Lachnospiraceae bacterium]|nr:hypothetical protein [Lachnospiraceae bacterium]
MGAIHVGQIDVIGIEGIEEILDIHIHAEADSHASVFIKVFMVSREAADIIHMYDPAIPYISAVLFDKEMQESIVYYMPLLEEAGRQEYKNRPLVRQKQDRRYQIIARMDMIESLLVRGAAGITLSEIKGAP